MSGSVTGSVGSSVRDMAEGKVDSLVSCTVEYEVDWPVSDMAEYKAVTASQVVRTLLKQPE